MMYERRGLTCWFDVFQHIGERPEVWREKGHKIRSL
jgi:hypothetical protein